MALNLLKVDESMDGPDQVNYAALSIDAGRPNPTVKEAGFKYGEIDYLADSVDNKIYGTKTGDTIPYIGKAPYASLFERSRFWVPSESNLLNTAALGLGTGDSGSYEHTNFLNFANVGTDEIAILVFKPEGIKGFDITAEEWWGGKENIPYGWIRPSDYISDYFLRIVAVKGNWSNYPQLSTHKIWGKYFDKDGIMKNMIDLFSGAEGVTFIGSWTGCIIPDFVDKKGNWINLRDKVNAQTEITGLLMSVNEDAMQAVAYDLNGVDLETGEQTGRGHWVYDFDNNGEAETEMGEDNIESNGFIVDMVGHGFQNGLKMSTQWDEWDELDVSYGVTAFDAGRGLLDTSVYYLDATKAEDASSRITTVIIPSIDADTQEPLILYPIYNASTGSSVKNNKKSLYIALTNTKYKELGTSTSSGIHELSKDTYKDNKLYYKDGTEDASTLATLPIFESTTFCVRESDITLDTSIDLYYGSYAGFNTSTNQMVLFEVFSNAGQSQIDTIKIVSDVKANAVQGDTSVYDFSYGGRHYQASCDTDGVIKADKVYVRSNTEVADIYGFSFLSYNYTTNDVEDVAAPIKNVAYFNGKVLNTSTGTEDTLELIDSSLFYGINPVSADTLNMFIVTDQEEADKITIGDYVNNITFNNEEGAATIYGLIPGVTRVTKKQFVVLAADYTFTYNKKKYTFNRNISQPILSNSGLRGFYVFTALDPVRVENAEIVRQLPISHPTISHSLRFIPLKGLQITSRHRPGFDASGRLSINEGIEKIYSMLNEDGIKRGLCNPNMIDYRYIVDSMSYGIDNEMGGKVYLTRLASERLKTTALLNVPSKRQFELSSDPSFCKSYDTAASVKPSFDAKYIATGGNVDMYSTRLFTLPTEDDGSKFAGAFWPHLVYQEGTKKILVPPAGDVSNTFIQKFQGGDPYSIVANTTGIINNEQVVGVEYDADTADRDYLEPLGINTIIQEQGVVKIYGNQTCYQDTKSDFNKLHVRENLNTLEIACDEVLKSYNFKYNTPQLRASIVTALTPICEAMRISGAIDNYNIICNEDNNTEELIMEDFGIVDIEVWMNHGMEKIIQRIRLRRHDTLNV